MNGFFEIRATPVSIIEDKDAVGPRHSARSLTQLRHLLLHVLLRREGASVNHKRVPRIYREGGLSIRRKKRKH